MAPYMTFLPRYLFGNLWLFKPILQLILKLNVLTRAMLRTTCVFTMAQAGTEFNVVPTTASVTANFRFGLHQDLDQSVLKLEKMAKRIGVEMELLGG
jgi:carboxypeptidase PM20D1